MPEKITSAATQARVFGVGGRPRRTGIEELASAVDGITNLGVDILERKRTQEIESAEERLNDVGIQPTEIQEIVDGAAFEGTKRRAFNVQGEQISRERRAELEDEIRVAPDALAAHDIVARYRQEDQAKHTNPHIRSGIGDGYTDFAPKLLEDAAQRRIRNSARAEAVAKAETFRADWELDPNVIPERIAVGHQRELDTGGNVTLYHKDVVNTALNNYAEFPAEGDVVVDQLQAYIDGDPLLESKERDIYLAGMRSIRKDQEARRNAVPKGPNTRLANAHKRLGAQRINTPGFRVETELINEGLNAAETPAEVTAWLRAVQGVDETNRVVGIGDTPEASQKRDILESTLSTTEGVFPLERGEVLLFWDRLMRSVPSDVQDDPNARERFTTDAFREVTARAATIRTKAQAEQVRLKQELLEFNKNVADLGRIGPDKIQAIKVRRARLLSDALPANAYRRAAKAEFNSFAEELNWADTDLVDTTLF